jgi:hypothetical protein
MSAPGTGLPIRAPGHGQGTEEERVERPNCADCRFYAYERGDCHRHAPERDGMDARYPHVGTCGWCGDWEPQSTVLAAAATVPGPEVKWTEEPPNEPGWYWIRCKTIKDDPNGYSQITRPAEFVPADAYVVAYCIFCDNKIVDPKAHEWWPVPISEPPVTKGEGGK